MSKLRHGKFRQLVQCFLVKTAPFHSLLRLHNRDVRINSSLRNSIERVHLSMPWATAIQQDGNMSR